MFWAVFILKTVIVCLSFKILV